MKKWRIRRLTAAAFGALMIMMLCGTAIAQAETEEALSFDELIASMDDDTAETTENYENLTKIAAKDGLILYGNEETGLFVLEHASDGFRWYSTPEHPEDDSQTRTLVKNQICSQIYLSYVLREGESATADVEFANSFSECVSTGNLTVTPGMDGMRVYYRFESIDMTIPVEYRLADGYLEASVLLDELDEGDDAYLIDLYLLPGFGAEPEGTDGYLFVPDGSGALVDFEEHLTLNTDMMLPVYGADRAIEVMKKSTTGADVHLPVFGTIRGTDALMGVMDTGADNGSVKVSYRNAYCRYSAIGSVLNYRVHGNINLYKSSYNQTMYRASRQHATGDRFTVRYYALAGDKATYMGMAERYRQYLIDEHALSVQVQKPTMQVELYGMAEVTSSFFGIPYTRKVQLTTFSQASQIVSDLQKQGLTDLSVRYIGWTGDGIENTKVLKNTKPLRKLGGKSGWNAFTKQMRDSSVMLYPDLDLIQFRKGGNGISTRTDVARTLFDKIANQYRFSRSIFSRIETEKPTMLLNAAALQRQSNRLLSSYNKAAATGVGLGTLGNINYSSLQENGMSRAQFSESVSQVLKAWQSSAAVVGVESANAYALGAVGCVWDAPLFSSAYDIYETDVPFYSLVLHGYVTMTTPPILQSANPQTMLLKAVETGSELLYAGMYADSSALIGSAYDNHYSSTYTLWMEKAKTAYEAYMPILKTVWDQPIVGHRQISPGVFATQYANGVSVAVNYTASDVTLGDGTVCKALSFATMQEVSGE